MSTVKILAVPKDPNPYQELLYEPVRAAGATVEYAVGPTPSQSVNLALAPLMLAWYRARGFNVLHLHWVHGFYFPWAQDVPLARSFMEWWFRVYLQSARRLGFKVVWTAHDLLPHWPVFRDDERARNRLLEASDLVVALSGATARTLTALGSHEVVVIPFGSYVAAYDSPITKAEARERLGLAADELVVLNIGRIERYKGADLLLDAMVELPAEWRVRAVIAGECVDDDYRPVLEQAAARAGERALLRLERIPDEEMATYLRAADVACFPLRAISNSSSILLAQSFGLPTIIPDLENLADIPDDSVIRHELGAGGVATALREFSRLDGAQREAMGRAAKSFADSCDWPTVGRRHLEAFEDLVAGRATTVAKRSPAGVAR